jgi:pimeloyl-ACP methyl ester carboxylesterase
MARIIMIHGWRVRDRGKRTLGPLADALRDLEHEVILYSYGYVFTRRKTEMVSRKTAKLLSTKIEPGDVVIGHSNGARVAFELSFYAPLIRRMVWLNPALDPDVVPAKTVQKCLVVHSKRDRATRIAKWLPGSIWGAMGTVGYLPSEEDGFPVDRRMKGLEHSGRHSDYHLNPKMWARFVDKFIG